VDLRGRVYEYFLTRLAFSEARNGGQFYTPSWVWCAAHPIGGRMLGALTRAASTTPAAASGACSCRAGEVRWESHGAGWANISIYRPEKSNATHPARLAVDETWGRAWHQKPDFGPRALPTAPPRHFIPICGGIT